MSVEDNLIELLETFNMPVIRQGSLPEDEAYPATFFTFWNPDEYEHSAYDNDTASAVYSYDVNVYSSDPDTAYSLLREARKLLKQNGWIIGVRGYDAASDEITHIGRGMAVYYLKNEIVGG